MSELKPCPFCKHFAGFSVILPYEEYPGHVACMFCGAETPFDIWNTRPIEDALRARIAELEAKQRWIPVSKRLPEEFTPVLTIGKDELPITAVVDGGHWYSSFEYSLNVTHWMPLPEPPEDNDNEPA